MKFASCLALVALVAAPAALRAATPPPPELPVASFFESAKISNLQFSPNGKFILCVVPYERRQNLAVIDLEKGTKNLLTNFKDKQVQGPLWANDTRILFRVDDDGQESYSLYAVNRDGSDPVILATGYARSGSTGEINSRFTGLLRRLRNDKQHILVTARINNTDWNDVARMNLRTGRMTVVAPAPGNVITYVLDRNDEVRAAVVQDPDWTRRVLYREKAGQPWKEIFKHGYEEPGWVPITFDGDNRTLFMASNLGRKTYALYRYDTQTHQLSAEPLIADDTFDVVWNSGGSFTGLQTYYDFSRNKVVGFSYEGAKPTFRWIDDELAAIHARLNASLPDTSHAPIQFSDDGSHIIFGSSSDRDPGVYYLYDRKSQKLQELAVIVPGIDPAQLASVKPISFQARDGLTLHGYLTLPAGREPKNLPLVVHPHGGPYGPRDAWRYNPEVQFYANRGFAVLQVNFRGSGGHGSWFEAAGFKKWGLEMQDDLTDGVKWLIAQGVANPRKVVISGASYGGYATMAGLVYTPELYAAGINYVGVVNIETLLPKAVASSRAYWFNTRIGDFNNAEDRKRIYATSPVNFADRIRAPLLMAYGRNDPRVPVDQAYDIKRALERAGVPHELIIEDDEGHGFRKEEKSIAFYTKVDAFLKQHVLQANAEVDIGQPKVVEMPAKMD